MKVRLAQIGDIEKIVMLDLEANLTYWTRVEYLECFNNKTQLIYVLEAKNKEIVGVVVLSVVCDEAEILQFFIKRESQRCGYGKILLQSIIERLKIARGVQRMFLEVRENNVAAISLYKSCRFKIVSRRIDYYQVDNWRFDAIVMFLECV